MPKIRVMNYADLIAHFKTPSAAARAIGVKPSSVFGWKTDGIAWDRQMQIQVLTKGKLKAEPNPLLSKVAA